MEIIKRKIESPKGGIAISIHKPDMGTDKLAILCPGYLDSKDYAHLVALANMLAARGYVAVRLDPTGTWESGGEISDYTTTQYLEDIRTVLEFMLGEDDFKQVLLGGHSRGGQLSILYAARDNRISTVLGIMASTGKPYSDDDEEKWEKEGVRISQRDLPSDRERRKEFRVPFSHALDKNRYNGFEDIIKIHAPVILIAGELDDLVTPEETRELFDKANEPKKMAVIANIGHNYRLNDNEIEIVNGKISELLDAML
jgi:pimeloyl-ACP methyl ester carboxylesterase